MSRDYEGRVESSQPSWVKQGAEELRRHAERLGVPVRTEGMVQFSQLGVALLAAPATGLEAIPATRYPEGVDLGAAYLDLPGKVSTRDGAPLDIPGGFYRLRAVAAEAREVGKVGGRVQLVNAEGRVVAEVPADFEIRSLTVPPEAQTQRTVLALTAEPSRGGGERQRLIVIGICWLCPNGMWVCLIFVFASERIAE
jgi:hypothetical protein